MSAFHRISTAAVAIAITAAAPPVLAASSGFVDPMSAPAAMSPLAQKSLLQGVARAGDRLVAVGQRGHILVSPDNGTTWKQSKVPVSSDLNAVFFVNDRRGWVVGHDGVVLNTTDGGDTWTLQFDGARANERLVEDLEHRVQSTPASAELKQLLEDAKRYKEQGADKPLLDVWFADESNGYIVGAYNMVFRTNDGGKNWQPWFDRTDNPKLFNLHAIRPAAGGLFIVGEALVLKLDVQAQRFRALNVPYKGSFFGVVGDRDGVLVYGLRGNAFRSDDGGKSWSKVDVGLPATIVAGTQAGIGTIVLIDASGRVVASADGGRNFIGIPMTANIPVSGVAEIGNGRYALVGPGGVAVVERRQR